MARLLTIADAHSTNRPKQKVTLQMEGGDPWFAYIWINDTCFSVTRRDGSRYLKITRVK